MRVLVLKGMSCMQVQTACVGGTDPVWVPRRQMHFADDPWLHQRELSFTAALRLRRQHVGNPPAYIL